MIQSRSESSQTVTFSKDGMELTFDMRSSDECMISPTDDHNDINYDPKINVNLDVSIIPTLAEAFASLCNKGGE